jgi:hypothetical protein
MMSYIYRKSCKGGVLEIPQAGCGNASYRVIKQRGIGGENVQETRALFRAPSKKSLDGTRRWPGKN